MDGKEKITYFAETDARNKRVKFGIKDDDRLRHIYSIGKTGTGKSTMLENMIIDDPWRYVKVPPEKLRDNRYLNPKTSSEESEVLY